MNATMLFHVVANQQVRHLDTHKAGSDSLVIAVSTLFPSGVCVGIYGLTYSLINRRRVVFIEKKGQTGEQYLYLFNFPQFVLIKQW